jgi:hypothetical protein
MVDGTTAALLLLAARETAFDNLAAVRRARR